MMLTAGLVACGGEQMAEPQQAESATLRGTVFYRERMALPINASIDVRLLDVSLQDVPSKVLAQQTIEAAGQSVPIPFELVY